MKSAQLSLFLLAMVPSYTFAAQVYGTLRESGRSIGSNVKVEVICGSSTYSAMTDNYGSYRLFAREQGRCTLRVYFQNQAPEAVINSYTDAVQYDFNLVRNPSGQYSLERK